MPQVRGQLPQAVHSVNVASSRGTDSLNCFTPSPSFIIVLTRARQLIAGDRLVLQAGEFVLAFLVAVVPVSVARLLDARLVLAHPISLLYSAAAGLGAL